MHPILFRGPGQMWRWALSGPRATVWGPLDQTFVNLHIPPRKRHILPFSSRQGLLLLLPLVFCSIFGEGPGSRSKDLRDPGATLTPADPGYDTQPLTTQERLFVTVRASHTRGSARGLPCFQSISRSERCSAVRSKSLAL